MKIGMGIPTLGFHGGIERHAHDLACSLARRGHTLTLLHGPAQGRDVLSFIEPFADVRPLADARSGAGLDVAYLHKVKARPELASLGALPVAIASHDHDLTCVRRHRYLPIGNTPCHLSPGIKCVTSGCILVRDRRPVARLLRRHRRQSCERSSMAGSAVEPRREKKRLTVRVLSWSPVFE